MKCAQRGVVVLGSPVGHPAFVQAWAEDRLRAEQELLDQLPKLPDLQCAWLLLLLSALGGLGLQPAEAIAPAAWADALPAINARLPSSAATYMRLLESEAVGAEGQVVPQQWLAHTTATGVPTEDRRRLDLVVYGSTANGGRCAAT